MGLAGLTLSALLSACIYVDMPDEKGEQTLDGGETDFDSPLDSIFPALTSAVQTTSGRPAIVETTGDEPVIDLPITEEDDLPTLSDEEELRDYLLECTRRGEYEPIFRYTGDEDFLWDYNFADMLGVVNTRVANYRGQSRVYQMEIINYPGDRMLAAYLSGDRSALRADEQDALDLAIEVVEEAERSTDSELELELYLHDWICDQVVYDNSGTDFDDPLDLPYHLSALGVLLGDSVNCQGYTDAFYLLASMAGFEVDRQVGSAEGQPHIFNTVCFDGEWYIVDVTHDDDTWIRDEGDAASDYRFFNVGRDYCTHKWNALDEHREIAEESGEEYFYHFEVDGSEYGYQKTFYSIDELAESVIYEWSENGRDEHYAVLVGQKSDQNVLRDSLYDYALETGLGFSYVVWGSVWGENTYFYVEFS